MTSHNDKTQPATDLADSPNKRHAAALLTAAALAAVDGMPAVFTWSTEDGRVEAHLDYVGADATTLAHLHQWATFFSGSGEPIAIHSEPFGTHSTSRSTRVWVETTRDGVHVEIWSTIFTPGPADASVRGADVVAGVSA
ncbi:hypothetical protein [Spirillospora sp. CA-294931]|uniref:hypothetical protein n=1 Tax=Spirillospora sp. CA-294931 TaxID=3240042 RepID=UPI003D95011E